MSYSPIRRITVLLLTGAAIVSCRAREDDDAKCRIPSQNYVLKGRYKLVSQPCVRLIEDPSANADSIPGDGTLALAFARYSRENYDLFFLSPDGACDYQFMVVNDAGVLSPKRLQFRLSPEEIQTVRKAVSETGIYGLSLEYDAGFADGEIIVIECCLGGRYKSVTCHNHFPDVVVTLNDFVCSRLLYLRRESAHWATAKDGRLFSDKKLRNFAKAYESKGERRE
jgi:hypothetical protein